VTNASRLSYRPAADGCIDSGNETIHLTRLNKDDLIVNADLIEFIESTPDTVLTLLTGKKLMVRESPEEIMDKVIEYRHKVGPVVLRPLDRAVVQTAREEREGHDDEVE
jgi:flagellar protein FlbD